MRHTAGSAEPWTEGVDAVCLLILLTQTHAELPLVVAANRDELLDRPAEPMAVLREAGPRILGGVDQLAGGTWLAVNDAGVVAGLTNRPTSGPRDPSKRSRGELPLALAGHASARAAVEAFTRTFRPSDYNPAWILVGDREAAFAVDMTGGGEPLVSPLAPGVHVLENRAIGSPSPKAAHVRRLLDGVDGLAAGALEARLRMVLGDHEVPPGDPAAAEVRPDVPPEANAACVHAERYGTRWSAVVSVPADTDRPAVLRYADGRPCEAEYRDAGSLWTCPPTP